MYNVLVSEWPRTWGDIRSYLISSPGRIDNSTCSMIQWTCRQKRKGDKVKPNKPNQVDRYIVSFRDRGRDYYKADCAFRDEQKGAAIRYSEMIRLNLCSVVGGKVYDCWMDREVFSWEREV